MKYIRKHSETAANHIGLKLNMKKIVLCHEIFVFCPMTFKDKQLKTKFKKYQNKENVK